MRLKICRDCLDERRPKFRRYDWHCQLRSANQLAKRKALKASGIEDFRWHDLRHTWASWFRQNNVSTWVLQELGAWKSESTMRRYAHLSVAHLQSYAERLNSVDTLKTVAPVKVHCTKVRLSH